MSFLLDVAYAFAGAAALPVLWVKRRRTGKYRTGLPERFGWGAEPLPRKNAGERILLLHCVSVGELNSVQTLIDRLLAADDHLRIVLSTTTDTGTQRAAKLFPQHVAARVHPLRFPFDFSFAVERLFDRIQPDAIALVELETWPNFLAIAHSRRIPVAIINARLSEKSFPRYRLIRPVMAAMLRKIDWIGAQTPAIAQRFEHLGAHPAKIEVIPTLKYDNAHITDTVPGQEPLAAAIGLNPDHQLFVAGSTGPGEEEPLLATYAALREKFPALRLALVPRHPEVIPQVIAAIQSRGLTPILRTDRPDPLTSPLNLPHSAATTPPPVPPLASSDVFLLNTMGELRKLYALAFAVFVGRSLFKKGGGGSDMIEVAALAKPCCFGPFTSNFAEVVELMLREKTAIQLTDASALTPTLESWLLNPPAARDTGRRAQSLIRQQQGSTTRYVQRLLQLCARALVHL